MSYDRLDWHLDRAIEAGQPLENGFTHIGLYLAWLIRHDLHEPGFFPVSHVAFWARDGLVVHLAGRADLVEAAIPKLP